MADDKKFSTYSVKLNSELKQEIHNLVEGYTEVTGATSGDFVKMLLDVYKTNKLVSKISSTDADIRELNTLTTRIYNIYSNLIERNSNSNNALQHEYAEQLIQNDTTLNNLKAKVSEIEQENDILKEAYNNICEDKGKLNEYNKQLQELNNSYKLNISKLQEQIAGLQEVKQVNGRLVYELDNIKQLTTTIQTDNINLRNSIKDKEFSINQLNITIERTRNEHIDSIDKIKQDRNNCIESLKDKSELERDKALLQKDKMHQQEIEKIQSKHNEEVQEYQTIYKSLLQELEKVNGTLVKKPDTPKKA